MKPGELPDDVNIRLARSVEEIEGACIVEYETFLEAGYIEANSQQRVLEFEEYDPFSDFFVLIKDTLVIGMLRRMRPSTSLELKTLRDFEINPDWKELEKIAQTQPTLIEEIGTLGLLKEYRGLGLRACVAALYRASWQDSVRRGVKYWLFSADAKLFWALSNWFGFAVQQIGHDKYYMGSQTIPAVLPIQQQLEIYRRGESVEEGEYFLKNF